VSGELIRVISDLHYGDPSSRVRRLAQLSPLLHAVDHLVLNGDSLDTRPGPNPSHTASCRAEVLTFFPRLVPRVTFLTGNHDADISPHHSFDLAAGEVFVTHGDIVFDDIVPWSRDAAQFGMAIASGLHALPAPERGRLDRRLAIWRAAAGSVPQRHQSERHTLRHLWRYFGDTLWPPHRCWRVLRAWQAWPHAVAALVEEHLPKARFVLAGHIHRPAIWRSPSDTVIINTGSFCLPLGACAVDLVDGGLTVRKIERRGGDFHPGKILAEFPLAGGPRLDRISESLRSRL